MTFCAAENKIRRRFVQLKTWKRPTSRWNFEVYTARKTKGMTTSERKSVHAILVLLLNTFNLTRVFRPITSALERKVTNT